jgi:hypothetical protein
MIFAARTSAFKLSAAISDIGKACEGSGDETRPLLRSRSLSLRHDRSLDVWTYVALRALQHEVI